MTTTTEVARVGATAALVELALALRWEDVPPDGAELVRRAFLDCLGCAVAGAADEDAAPAVAWVGSLGGTPDCTIVGTSQRAPAALAALANGTSAHALDLDDFSPTMMHPSVCLVPPALALGERSGASGRDVALAYVAGFEAMARLCRALNPAHYARGWHATATAGVIGAAVTAGRLLGLGRADLTAAIGIAASWAGGLRENFGSAVKPLHAGSAGLHGIAAAELAAAGMTAGPHILDGERGFFAVFGGLDADPSAFAADGLELARSGIAFKRFACCGAIHTALDALLDLRAEHELCADDVASIECGVNKWAPEILIHHVANTPAEGRFCVEYSLAVAMVDNAAGVAQYRQERLADTAVRSLMERVSVHVDPNLTVDKTAFPATVSVSTRDGRQLTRHVEAARGTPGMPLERDELEEKFRACVSGILHAEAAEAALRAATSIDELADVRGLARALATA